MPWLPEMEMIDQLIGGDLPLTAVSRLFDSDERARKVVGLYLGKGIVVFIRQESTMPLWESLTLLRNPEPLERHEEVRVSITDYGARAFESGAWHAT
jgi:hypothetical protein